jgi:hypothetical protein
MRATFFDVFRVSISFTDGTWISNDNCVVMPSTL